jgi:hypothetical protein
LFAVFCNLVAASDLLLLATTLYNWVLCHVEARKTWILSLELLLAYVFSVVRNLFGGLLGLWRTGTIGERDNENPAPLLSETVRALSAIKFCGVAQI